MGCRVLRGRFTRRPGKAREPWSLAVPILCCTEGDTEAMCPPSAASWGPTWSQMGLGRMSRIRKPGNAGLPGTPPALQ